MTPDYHHPHPWKTKDPDWGQADRKGMLLSDQIHRFCTERQPKGLLISDGYDDRHLRPAAYTLTIGNVYCDAEGKKGQLSKDQPSFEMPPNSIVFVSIAESLDLPYYIAARFNLRVDWVYKGILLGTGPQVEPGFRGQLSCPLYNLTNRPHTIILDDEFATIDFERTTNFVDKPPADVEPQSQRRGDKLWSYKTEDNKEFLLFDQMPLEALKKYPKDYKIVSSLTQMQHDLQMWRRIGLGVVVSFIALTLTLLNFQSNLLRETIATQKDLAQTKNDATQLKDQVIALQKDLDETRKVLGKADNELRDTQKEVQRLQTRLH